MTHNGSAGRERPIEVVLTDEQFLAEIRAVARAAAYEAARAVLSARQALPR